MQSKHFLWDVAQAVPKTVPTNRYKRVVYAAQHFLWDVAQAVDFCLLVIGIQMKQEKQMAMVVGVVAVIVVMMLWTTKEVAFIAV